MSTATDRIEPILHTEGGDMDSATTVEVYERHRLEISLRKLLEVNYGVYDHLSGEREDNQEALRYRGSGCWFKRRGKHGELIIDFSVGCWCEHDCCGHLCSLSITVQQTDRHFIVITNKSFNY